MGGRTRWRLWTVAVAVLLGAMPRMAGAQPVAVPLDPAFLAAAPSVHVAIAAEPGHGAGATYDGPLLWSLLERAGAVDEAHPKNLVRMIVTVTGSDGYAAVLAVGEIAPQFEAKQVILAMTRDGTALGAGHLKLVVTGDHRGARSVHDVARITAELMMPEKVGP